MLAHRYVEENGSAAMLAAKRLVGVALEVNFREHVTHMPLPSMKKAAYSDFETLKPRGDVTRNPKQGYQAQKALMSSINFKKEEKNYHNLDLIVRVI